MTDHQQITAQLRSVATLDVISPSGVTGLVTYNDTFYGEDGGMVVIEYTSGFAAGVTEPVCELGDTFLADDFLSLENVSQAPHHGTS